MSALDIGNDGWAIKWTPEEGFSLICPPGFGDQGNEQLPFEIMMLSEVFFKLHNDEEFARNLLTSYLHRVENTVLKSEEKTLETTSQ